MAAMLQTIFLKMHFHEFDSIWVKFISNGLIYNDRRQTIIWTNYKFD